MTASVSAADIAYRQAWLAVVAMQQSLRPKSLQREVNRKIEKVSALLGETPSSLPRLRKYWPQVSGSRNDYFTYDDPAERDRFEHKLRELKRVDRHGVFVSEREELGGTGHRLSLGLTNLETLKHYECLIAMDLGGALARLRRMPQRHVVIDASPGWGGLSYALKTLFPNTTIIICDEPHLFLFSATYLNTVFPASRSTFITDRSGLLDNWEDHDFVFVPWHLHQTIKPERLDLVVSSSGSCHFSSEQMRSSAELAARYHAPTIYWLQHFNQTTSAVELYYWLHEIPVLLVPYTELLDGRRQRVRPPPPRIKDQIAERRQEIGYRHLIGWKHYG